MIVENKFLTNDGFDKWTPEARKAALESRRRKAKAKTELKERLSRNRDIDLERKEVLKQMKGKFGKYKELPEVEVTTNSVLQTKVEKSQEIPEEKRLSRPVIYGVEPPKKFIPKSTEEIKNLLKEKYGEERGERAYQRLKDEDALKYTGKNIVTEKIEMMKALGKKGKPENHHYQGLYNLFHELERERKRKWLEGDASLNEKKSSLKDTWTPEARKAALEARRRKAKAKAEGKPYEKEPKEPKEPKKVEGFAVVPTSRVDRAHYETLSESDRSSYLKEKIAEYKPFYIPKVEQHQPLKKVSVKNSPKWLELNKEVGTREGMSRGFIQQGDKQEEGKEKRKHYFMAIACQEKAKSFAKERDALKGKLDSFTAGKDWYTKGAYKKFRRIYGETSSVKSR